MTDPDERLEDLQFDVHRSICQHERRQQFLASWHSFTQVRTVIPGSTSAGAFIEDKDYSYVPALVLTVLTAIDMVAGVSRKASMHQRLREAFLLLRLDCQKDATGDTKSHIPKDGAAPRA